MLLVMKDLNVQYFPCKICGAKSPSYYFVHKHKKLWHRAQLELEQKLEQQQQKLVDLKKSEEVGESDKPDQPTVTPPMQNDGF